MLVGNNPTHTFVVLGFVFVKRDKQTLPSIRFDLPDWCSFDESGVIWPNILPAIAIRTLHSAGCAFGCLGDCFECLFYGFD